MEHVGNDRIDMVDLIDLVIINARLLVYIHDDVVKRAVIYEKLRQAVYDLDKVSQGGDVHREHCPNCAAEVSADSLAQLRGIGYCAECYSKLKRIFRD